MRRLLSVCCMFFVAGGAMADEQCDDLWFARSAILAQGGYCVETDLGKALFGSEDCSDEEPEFPDYLAEQMTKITTLEAELSCDVDETAQELKIWQAESRKSLLIQPVNSGRDDRCVMKAPTSLRVAPSPDADQLGWLERGDLILLVHDKAGGADFAARVRRGSVITEDIGWFSGSQCKPL